MTIKERCIKKVPWLTEKALAHLNKKPMIIISLFAFLCKGGMEFV